MINSLHNKTIFITGSSKNAGKTTFLNYLLPELRKNTGCLAYLTIGIDGEKEDMIFGTPKPGIYAKTGDFIVTCASAFQNSDTNFEIIEVFPYTTKLGKLILIKILRPGSIELIGPENNAQLNHILHFLKTEKNIKTIIIDGAVNRITQITSAPDSEFIYVMKVSANDIMKSINQIKTLSLIKNFSQITDDVINRNEFYCYEGALTGLKASRIPENKKDIILNDFTKIFLSWNELSDLLKKKKIYYRENFKLNCISVNLYDISRTEFKNILNSNNINEKVLYNPYEYI